MRETDSEESSSQPGAASDISQRLDRWLWFARILKSRTMAAEMVAQGKVRVNRARVVKPSHPVRCGDVLTIALRGRVQVVRIRGAGLRRGPPQEARALYEDLASTSSACEETVPGRRPSGQGRPTKKDRRDIERLQDEE